VELCASFDAGFNPDFNFLLLNGFQVRMAKDSYQIPMIFSPVSGVLPIPLDSSRY